MLPAFYSFFVFAFVFVSFSFYVSSLEQFCVKIARPLYIQVLDLLAVQQRCVLIFPLALACFVAPAMNAAQGTEPGTEREFTETVRPFLTAYCIELPHG